MKTNNRIRNKNQKSEKTFFKEILQYEDPFLSIICLSNRNPSI